MAYWKERTPCRECGGPKPSGAGRKYCDDCRKGCSQHPTYQLDCSKCTSEYDKAWRKANPGRSQRTLKKSLYGLTDEQYDQLEAIESCENCGSSERMVIDHNHTTGKVRGKLCHKCNVALGMARDSIAVLEGLINYLKERD